MEAAASSPQKQLTPCSYTPPSESDQQKVALIAATIIAMISSSVCMYYASGSPLSSLLLLGTEFTLMYAVDHIAELSLFDPIAKICLRPFLHAKIENALTPQLKDDYYNHHRKEALQILPTKTETLAIETDDGYQLEAIWMPNSESDRVVVLCPGNSISAAVMATSWGRWYSQQGLNVCAYTTRGQRGHDGFGSSGERPPMAQELTLLQDGITVVDYLHRQKEFSYDKIGLHGYSTGAAIATYITTVRAVGQLVTDRGFLSFSHAVSKAMMDFFPPDLLDTFYSPPPQSTDALIPTRLNTHRLIAHSQAPSILCIEATEDHYVFKGTAEKLAEEKSSQHIVFEGGHAIETAFSQISHFPAPDDTEQKDAPLILKGELEDTFKTFWNLTASRP